MRIRTMPPWSPAFWQANGKPLTFCYSAIRQACYASVLALLGDTIEAQDITQEASLQAFLGLSLLREPARFAVWFHAIAANLARSALRRRRACSLYALSDDDTIQMLWVDAPLTPQDTVQRFNSKAFSEHRRLHTPLVNQGELDRQLGDQPQKVVPAFGNKKAIRQDLPKEAGGLMGAGVHRSGWEMLVVFAGKNARDLKEETHQRLHQVRQELEDILTQRTSG